MHGYLDHLFWYSLGKYAGIGLILGAGWLSRQRRLPHRHGGYVSAGGYVHACARCGKLPAGAYRKGPYGTEPELPQSYLDAVTQLDSQPDPYNDEDWVTCPACGREDVARQFMHDGMCPRCRIIMRTGSTP